MTPDYPSTEHGAARGWVHASRLASEAFPIAVPPEEAEPRVRRALMEAWTGRETAASTLPPMLKPMKPLWEATKRGGQTVNQPVTLAAETQKLFPYVVQATDVDRGLGCEHG